MNSLAPSRGLVWGTAMVLGFLAALVAAGCGTPSRGPSVPYELQDRAVVPGIGPQARTWGGAMNADFLKSVTQLASWELEARAKAGQVGPLPRSDFLALSGGGSNGAFGAGLLCGWAEAGDRPTFKVVTGISTGALIAPFVFAGPEYDRVIREVYTKTKTGDILVMRGVLAALFDDSMADTRPLWKTLAKYVDQKLLDDIAREYRKGRLLVIGTTNLDADRAVLWNVGEIAASGAPNALEVVRRIMIASAAIPGAFPPVFFDVEADGKKYQEMHVDGGVMTQVFLYPPSLKLRETAEAAGMVRERRAFIIRNARLSTETKEVERNTLTIAGRAIDTLIGSQGIGDLYRTYLNAQRDGVDFNLACIPGDFKEESKEAFDPVYMSKLFQVGFDLAKKGYRWEKFPPGFEGMGARNGPE